MAGRWEILGQRDGWRWHTQLLGRGARLVGQVWAKRHVTICECVGPSCHLVMQLALRNAALGFFEKQPLASGSAPAGSLLPTR